MIYSPNDYSDCRVLVYNEVGGKLLAEAKIVRFERTARTICVSRGAFKEAPQERVSVLIFFQEALHEYMGTVRKSGTDSKEYIIALYKGKEKEERTSIRYRVDVPAVVENYIIVGKRVPLHSPLEVRVINISTKGCLIRGNSNRFNIGATFQMKLDLGDGSVLLTAKVRRTNTVNATDTEYGCEF